MSPNPSESLNRTPPCNLDAERAVLGACMLDVNAAYEVRGQLNAADFFSQRHRQIFICVQQLLDQSQPCDPVTVGDALRKAGQLDEAGGMAYLSGLLDAVPSPSAAVHYAGIISDKAQLRQLLAAADEILASGYGGSADGPELLELAQRLVFEVAQGRQRGDFVPLAELLKAVFLHIGEIRDNDGVTGIPTFPDLDKQCLSGLHNSDLIILAARPGVGKTSMAMNIAQNAAAKYKKVVAVFSLEMPKEQLVQRMLCTCAEVDQSRAGKGKISKEDLARLRKAVASLSGAEIYIDDTMFVTVADMRSKCRKLKMEHGLDLIVVDYIQLMQGGGGRHTESRQLEVAEISRGLKALAKDLNVPVLALSQLSRLADRSDEPPNLSHLRESGALEQDADVVIMLHQPKAAAPSGGAPAESSLKQSKEGDIVKVIVAKHRNGPTGEVDMLFLKQYTAYRDLTESWVGEADIPPESVGAYVPDEPPPF